MRTVSVIALKGGSGKSTLAMHLALAAHLRGLDTLLADSDPQKSSHEILSHRELPGLDCVPVERSKLLALQFEALAAKRDLLIIDTPAGLVEDVAEAVMLSNLVVMVVRPTLIDLTALARTFSLVSRMGRPSLVVLNQAPAAREGVEPPLVKRALAALDYMKVPIAPVALRSRAMYQHALEKGRSVEETHDRAAAQEMAALWEFVQSNIATRTAKLITSP